MQGADGELPALVNGKNQSFGHVNWTQEMQEFKALSTQVLPLKGFLNSLTYQPRSNVAHTSGSK